MALGSSLYVENEVLHVGHSKWQMPHAIRRYQKSIWKRKNWNPWKQAGWGSVRNLYVVNWTFMFYIICISPFGFLQMLWKILNLCIAFSAALGLTKSFACTGAWSLNGGRAYPSLGSLFQWPRGTSPRKDTWNSGRPWVVPPFHTHKALLTMLKSVLLF